MSSEEINQYFYRRTRQGAHVIVGLGYAVAQILWFAFLTIVHIGQTLVKSIDNPTHFLMGEKAAIKINGDVSLLHWGSLVG